MGNFPAIFPPTLKMSCRRLTLRLISNCQRQSGFLLSSIKPQPQLLICSQQARDFFLASSFPTTASAAAATVSAASVAESAERWQLFASVIVERPRIVTKPMSDFDNDYRLMIEDFEHEKSIKSNHEMRVEQVTEFFLVLTSCLLILLASSPLLPPLFLTASSLSQCLLSLSHRLITSSNRIFVTKKGNAKDWKSSTNRCKRDSNTKKNAKNSIRVLRPPLRLPGQVNCRCNGILIQRTHYNRIQGVES